MVIGLFFASSGLRAQSNQYLHFNCTNKDHVILQNGSQHIANKPGITMAGWFLSDNLSYGQGLMGFRGTQGFYLIQLADGKLECRFQNAAGTLFEYVSPANTIIPGVWQHVAWVYDGSQIILYINGIVKGSKAASGSFTATNIAFTIGRSILGDLNFYWCGGIDEVSVWSKALSKEEIEGMMANELTGQEASLEMYYKFNQGVPEGNNTSITKLISQVYSPERDGDLVNFVLTGSSSNFVGTLDPSYQAISFDPISNKLISEPPFALTATSTSGLPVSLAVLSGPATIEGNMLTLTGEAGLVEIEATQEGDDTFDPAEPVVQRFHVLDPQTHLADIEIRHPLQGDVVMPAVNYIQLAAISTIQFPELFSVEWLNFSINGQVIEAEKHQDGHFTAWWLPQAHGEYTIEIHSANNFGAVKIQTVPINIVPAATNVAVQAFSGIYLNPTNFTETAEANLPSYVGAYDQIIGTLIVECPPGGCGAWDREAYLEAMDKEGNWIEIVRYITPYGKACSHSINLTDYMSILQGKTKFRITYSTYDNGYIYNFLLEYRAGTPEYLYSKVTEIWRERFPFGDYANLQPVPAIAYTYPPNTQASTLKLVSTGHGWGATNTSNAAEFYNAKHDIYVNGSKKFEQHNWNVCNPNPDGCQPQSGTWYHNRAGWCPGAIAPWFNFNMNDMVQHSTVNLGYVFFEGYVDFCHPNHPDCVTGVTCSDCNDGFNPVLDVACNMVAFSNTPFTVIDNIETFEKTTALNVFPNPSNGLFEVSLISSSQVKNAEIIVYDNLSRPLQRYDWNGQALSIDLRNKPTGLYYVKVVTPEWSEVKKVVVK